MTSPPTTSASTPTPNFRNAAAPSPSATQNTSRNARGPISAASGIPRISTMVSDSPMVPAKIGV